MTRLLGTSLRGQLNKLGFRSPHPCLQSLQSIQQQTEHNVLEHDSNQFSPPVRIVPSKRRRRTVTARLRSGVLELLVPSWMPNAERQQWAETMRRRLERRMVRRRPSDERLMQRARTLNDRHFGGRLRWTSIGFVDMAHTWGSCTFTTGAIRIARRAASLPDWVLDYLLVHELAHLEQSDHGPAFHELENRYPLTERARGYLMALDNPPAMG
jgi:predicted metal-dependent hydrolase